MAVSSVEPIRYSFDIEGMYKYTSCFKIRCSNFFFLRFFRVFFHYATVNVIRVWISVESEKRRRRKEKEEGK